MGERAEISLIPETNGAQERSTEEIIRDIELRRESIALTVEQAGQKMERSLDWREQARAHPYAALAIAAGAGFVVARSLRHRNTPGERLTATVTDNVDEIGTAVRRALDTVGRSRGGVARTIGTTLAAIAARSLVQTVRRRAVDRPRPNRTEGEHHES